MCVSHHSSSNITVLLMTAVLLCVTVLLSVPTVGLGMRSLGAFVIPLQLWHEAMRMCCAVLRYTRPAADLATFTGNMSLKMPRNPVFTINISIFDVT